MRKKQANFDSGRVLEAYALRYPDRSVIGVYSNRDTAFAVVAQDSARMLDLSYGYIVVYEQRREGL